MYHFRIYKNETRRFVCPDGKRAFIRLDPANNQMLVLEDLTEIVLYSRYGIDRAQLRQLALEFLKDNNILKKLKRRKKTGKKDR